jgi:hypothetical protein
MKLYTPDNAELIEVTAVTPSDDGVQIEGTIMGTMPRRPCCGPRTSGAASDS